MKKYHAVVVVVDLEDISFIEKQARIRDTIRPVLNEYMEKGWQFHSSSQNIDLLSQGGLVAISLMFEAEKKD